MALLESMKDPSVIVLSSDIAVVIKDKFPKAQFHFLVLPFAEIPSIFHVSSPHLGHLLIQLLKHQSQLSKANITLIDELELLGKNAIEVSGQPSSNFKMGFHASPSMQRLHLHVISQDFNSPALKTKIHWNSFTTDFFISCDGESLRILSNAFKVPDCHLGFFLDVRNSLDRLGRVEKWPDSRIKELKDTPLRCNQCDFSPKNIPDLKQHLIKHVKI
jgi:aprataxin